MPAFLREIRRSATVSLRPFGVSGTEVLLLRLRWVPSSLLGWRGVFSPLAPNHPVLARLPGNSGLLLLANR